jgi:tRNA1(Val) A37 N6-methylase TrmN6
MFFSMHFLNVKNSIAALTNGDFDKIVDTLAASLVDIDYHYNYSLTELHKDWSVLCKFQTSGLLTKSNTRAGMKLCEHYFPNFFDIQDSKGKSFSNCWTEKNLAKVLRWNRKSHSTPYLSEIRRGIYFCCGLTKNTMFRPHLSKIICSNYADKVVLDPCCGWGGRMLGALSSRKHYVGFEPNPQTYESLVKLARFVGVGKDRYTLICDGAENMNNYDFPNVDLVLTSPPYFNLEIYAEGKQQSENQYDEYSSWKDSWLKDVIQKSINRLNKNGHSAWNVHSVKNMPMVEDVEEIHKDLDFKHYIDISLTSSKRQANQKTKNKNSKNKDLTRIFVHKDQKYSASENSFLSFFSD